MRSSQQEKKKEGGKKIKLGQVRTPHIRWMIKI